MKYLSSWREKTQKVNSIVTTEMRYRYQDNHMIITIFSLNTQAMSKKLTKKRYYRKLNAVSNISKRDPRHIAAF